VPPPTLPSLARRAAVSLSAPTKGSTNRVVAVVVVVVVVAVVAAVAMFTGVSVWRSTGELITVAWMGFVWRGSGLWSGLCGADCVERTVWSGLCGADCVERTAVVCGRMRSADLALLL